MMLTDALRGEFERLPEKPEDKASREELRAMAREIASLATQPKIDHADLLCGEDGLPKCRRCFIAGCDIA